MRLGRFWISKKNSNGVLATTTVTTMASIFLLISHDVDITNCKGFDMWQDVLTIVPTTILYSIYSYNVSLQIQLQFCSVISYCKWKVPIVYHIAKPDCGVTGACRSHFDILHNPGAIWAIRCSLEKKTKKKLMNRHSNALTIFLENLVKV